MVGERLSSSRSSGQIAFGVQGPAAGPAPAGGAERSGGSWGALSHGQRALWFLHQLAPAGSAYNIAAAARVLTPIAAGALERAVQALVDRHAALRTTFPASPEAGGEPRQRVAAALTFKLERQDASGWSAERLRARLAEEAWRPFDLEGGPLLRVSLWTGGPGGPGRSIVLLVIHHIVADFWSLAVLMRELAALYREAAGGEPAALGAAGLAYEEHVWLEAEALREGRGEERLAYWRERLAGLPALELAADRPRPAVQTYHGGSSRLRLPAELASALRSLSRARHGTLFITLLAAFQTLLYRHTGQEDLAVGSPRSGRSQSRFAGTVGYFVNLVVLRGDLSGEPGFVELLARTKASVAADFAHGDYPLPLLAEHLVPERDASRTPLFQVSFVLQKETRGVEGLTAFALGEEGVEVGSADLRLSSLALPRPPAPFDLQLHAVERQGGLSLGLQYNSDLFDAATAARLMARFAVLLESIAADPGASIAELALLPAAERHQLLLGWNDPRDPGDAGNAGSNLFARFAAQAARTPSALALVAGEERLSYGELLARAAKLARSLRALGVGPEVPVGIFLPRRTELVVALLATLEAGGFYVPLDPAYPAERVAFMLADSNAAVVLTTAELAGRLPVNEALVVRLDALPEAAEDVPGETTPASLGNLAYLIYTSGSTGRPKGVAIEHRSAAALLAWGAAVFPPADLAGVLASTSITFDLSVFELFLPLATGGAVILADNALELPRLPAAGEVRLVNTVPSAIGALVRSGGVPPGVRTVNLAGEALKRALTDQLYALPGVAGVYNLYGPSEDTTYSTFVRVPREGGEPTIGFPIAGTRAYVLDRFLRLLPAGVAGELCLGGEGLARGYLGRPETTAERFVPDPFATPETAGERLYRTGDLARRRPDGELEFLGRLDHQVKIRGFRIELGEIEAALLAQAEIREAVVLAREDVPGEPRLVAYVAPELPARFDRELRERLGKRLPDFMIPAAFVLLPALPLTPNGKVDRKALPAPEWAGEVGWVGPRTPSEELLAGIWSEVLGVERIGVHDDFFALGGHSLLATRVVSRVREVLGVELPLRRLFEVPTVAELARQIEGGTRSEAPALVPVSRDQPLPLSFAQQRLWFLDQLEPGSAAYNIPAAVALRGRVDAAVLAAALSEVARRHESLRTRFIADRQVIDGPAPVVLPAVDLAGLPEALGAAEARRLARAEALRPFDLAGGPLLRSARLSLGAEEQVLLLTMHHGISDGWSLRLLARELGEIYGAFSQGLPSPLPELPVQYGDYAVWQREWLQGDVLAAELAHWRERLTGAPPVLDLPLDRPRTLAVSDRGGSRALALPASLLPPLQALARRQGVTLFMAVLAAFQALLSRVSHAEDVSVGTPVAGRNQLQTENLIGFFVNTLVLRTDLSAEPSFAGLLGRVREVALAAYAHQDLPFEKLVEELAPRRDLGVSPLFQVSFALDAEAPPALRLGGAAGSVWPLDQETEKFDLSLTLGLMDDGAQERSLAGTFGFRSELFDGATIERLAGHFARLLAGAVAEPDHPVSELPLLSAAERTQLAAWNAATARERPAELVGSTLPELFAAQVARTPAATALIAGEERLSYGELASRTAALAHRLRSLGVGPEVAVAIFLPRRAELLVALLATHAAGGFYVPLDPAYPAERVSFMLADSGAPVVLTTTELEGRLPAHGARVVRLDALPEAPCESTPTVPAISGNLAYVIYTSGSTGRPKAVAIEHRSAVALMLWSRREFSDRELSGILASTSITFDMSVFELFAPLAWGGTVILAENALALPELPAAAAGEVRVVDTVPSAMAELLRAGGVPASVVTVNLGGEAVQRALADRIYAEPGIERLYNVYGPSEDTTFSTWALIERESERSPSIGRPLDGEQAWVVDRHLQPVPVGVAGELFLGGEGVSRGYLGRPELTAERFVPDPFSNEPGARMYRVGDLVRYRPDGILEFLGRLDHQVKVRGYRIEPGEVESALLAHPAVCSAVVLPRADSLGATALVAYLETAPGAVSAGELRQHLKSRLPDYMVPSSYAFLESLPLTPNGKVDRNALAALPLAAGEAGGAEAPRTPSGELLAGIFAEVLGLARVGAEESFFELGGHSLLATQVVSRIKDAFGVELPLRRLFASPTVAGLAADLAELGRASGEIAAPPLARADRDRALPLSFAQARLWFLEQLRPGSPVYNMPVALRLSGELSVAVLRGAMSEVMRRHESLRTTFVAVDGQPFQRVLPIAAMPLGSIDLGGLAPRSRQAELSRLVGENAERPFDLAHGPLLRGGLVRLGLSEHALLLSLHHIVSDGWSTGILVREVVALYTALASGVPAPLPELSIQYPDFAVWQRKWLSGKALERQLGYWRERLSGLPALLELPTDRPRPAVRSDRGARLVFSLPGETLQGLKALGRRAGVTDFMALLGLFQALLARLTGQEQLAVGTVIANRGRSELEPLIGFFANTLVMRGDLSGRPSLREVLRRSRESALEAYAHQDLPFETLVEALQPVRAMSYTPLFQVMLALQNTPQREFALPGLEAAEIEESHRTGTARFDLTLDLEETPRSLAGSLEYATDLFDPSTVARWARSFASLLAAAIAAPSSLAQAVLELPLLDASERQQLVVEWNDTDGVGGTAVRIQELFERQAARRPAAPAVSGQGMTLAYGELEARANRLAHHLRSLGVGPETRVGLCVERSPEMVVALLGILKTGGAYVPLDPHHPAERLALVLGDSAPAVLVTEERWLQRLGVSGSLRVVCLDRDREQIAAAPASRLPLPSDGGAESLAYVIYTSGSTGRPKGVCLPHGALVNFLTSMAERLELGAGDVLPALTTLTFDIAGLEIYLPLAFGGRVEVIGSEEAGDGRQLAARVATSGVTAMQATPATWRLLVDSGWEGLPGLKALCGGEALPRGLASELLDRGVELWNLYGPTETAVWSAAGSVEDGEGALGLGRPIARTHLHVVDRALELVPAGVAGELLIGGAGVARGYWGRPDLTAERFLPDPWSGAGTRLYRTGDLVRHRPDGELEFLGRIDHQIKLRGFRIELGEIESVLVGHPEVREAVVLLRADLAGGGGLVAYVVSEGGETEALRGWLAERLPGYMVPAAFVALESLPLTPNGKVDRKALAALPLATHSEGEAARVEAPRTPAEELVAGIFAEVLGLERVGAEASFFELGGHSLLATQVASRVRSVFGVELPVRAVFEAPTVAALAARIGAGRIDAGKAMEGVPVLLPLPEEERRVLSFAQARLWFLDQLEPGSPLYNLPAAVRLTGALDRSAFAAALGEIVRRHEVLRTTFRSAAGEPVAAVASPSGIPLPLLDLAALPATARREEAARLTAESARRPFDLAADPLLRAALLALAAEEHVALVTLHHIASDGWSIGVLTRELAALYAAFRARTREPAAGAGDPVRRLRRLAAPAVVGGASGVGARLVAAGARGDAGGARPADGPSASGRPQPAGSGGRLRDRRRGARRSRRPFPAAGDDAVHDAAGRLRRAFAALHGGGRPGRRDAHRGPPPGGDGGADRPLRQHAGAARGPLGVSGPGDAPRAGKGDGARGLRPPGGAVRAPDRAGDAGAGFEPSAAGAGPVLAAERAVGSAGAAGSRADGLRGGDGDGEARAVVHSGRDGRRPLRGDRVQPRPVRERDDRAVCRSLHASAVGRRGGAASTPGGAAAVVAGGVEAAAGRLERRRYAAGLQRHAACAVRGPGGADPPGGRSGVGDLRRALDLSRAGFLGREPGPPAGGSRRRSGGAGWGVSDPHAAAGRRAAGGAQGGGRLRPPRS